MKNLSKAGEDLKSLANRLKAIVEVADALEAIGSIEQAERSALAQKDKAYSAAAEAEKACEIQKGLLAKAKEAVEAEHNKAKDLNERARFVSDGLLENARGKAAVIVKDADAKSDAIAASVKAAKAELFMIIADCENAKEDLAKFKSELEEVKKKLSAFIKG